MEAQEKLASYFLSTNLKFSWESVEVKMLLDNNCSHLLSPDADADTDTQK
jgi:hypothetical protein